jgi:hypothetical protein
MHNAPAVNFPVGRCHFLGRSLLFFGLIGLACCAAWWSLEQQPDWQMWLLALVWLASVLVAAGYWWQMAQGQLTWDGDHWCWSDGHADQDVTVDVALDGQWLMLLLLHGASGSPGIWLCVERTANPSRWKPLRRAVYQRPHPVTDGLVAVRPSTS